ncbi:CHAP domain-containing protein [Nocardioides sp. W3-2-3]|nr:CHAP domain-containing protein [Nocardioides convexus]
MSGRMYWNMYAGHNCTNYVAYRMIKAGMSTTRPWVGGGNASEWGLQMKSITDQVPSVGSVAWWGRYSNGSGSAGHVGYVERVVSPNEIIISMDRLGRHLPLAPDHQGQRSLADRVHPLHRQEVDHHRRARRHRHRAGRHRPAGRPRHLEPHRRAQRAVARQRSRGARRDRAAPCRDPRAARQDDRGAGHRQPRRLQAGHRDLQGHQGGRPRRDHAERAAGPLRRALRRRHPHRDRRPLERRRYRDRVALVRRRRPDPRQRRAEPGPDPGVRRQDDQGRRRGPQGRLQRRDRPRHGEGRPGPRRQDHGQQADHGHRHPPGGLPGPRRAGHLRPRERRRVVPVAAQRGADPRRHRDPLRPDCRRRGPGADRARLAQQGPLHPGQPGRRCRPADPGGPDRCRHPDRPQGLGAGLPPGHRAGRQPGRRLGRRHRRPAHEDRPDSSTATPG